MATQDGNDKDGGVPNPDDPSPSLPGPPRDDDPGKAPLQKMPWLPARFCKATEYRLPARTFGVEFSDDRSLALVQVPKSYPGGPGAGWNVHVFGQFVIRRQEDRGPGPSIEVEIVTNDEDIDVDVQWSADEQSVIIETPGRVPWHEALQPCVQIKGTIWVPDDGALKTLFVKATQLDVAVADNLRVGVVEKTDLGSVSGSVRGATDAGDMGHAAPPEGFRLGCRDVKVKTTSGDISGWWPLFDSLTVTTVSGDIKVGVGPQPADEARPVPATLLVQTTSGDVRISEPIKTALEADKPEKVLPPRDYVSSITSRSGDLRALAAFGLSMTAATSSGDIMMELLPVLDVKRMEGGGGGGHDTANLVTQTTSSDTVVNVLEPLWVLIPGPGDAAAPPSPPAPPAPPSPPWSWPRPEEDVPFVPIGDGDPYRLPLPLPPARLPAGSFASAEAAKKVLKNLPAFSSPRMVPAPSGAAPKLVCLKTKHEAVSGDVVLRLPGSWEGLMVGTTVSGDIDFKGVTVEKSKGSIGKTYKGRKGSGGYYAKSSTELSTVSGDILVVVGVDVPDSWPVYLE